LQYFAQSRSAANVWCACAVRVVEFAGSHRYVQDYLHDEVVLRQTWELQSFLMERRR
jgi:hypothetical protein